MPPKQWRNIRSVLSKRREYVDGLTCQVWVLYQSLDDMRVYVPDFSIYHALEMPNVFFKKVQQKGIFNWREEVICTQFENDFNDVTNAFEEAMLKLIGVGLDCVNVGKNGLLFHTSTDTYEEISKSLF